MAESMIEVTSGLEVYKAINAVQADLAKDGITKDHKNLQQGYSFRGIDDVYNAIAPLLAKHGLCILPRILTRAVVEKTTKSGGALFYVTVEAEFDFVSAKDGSQHVIRTFGEAMDSGDKATNKAMSAAYKYAAFQAFAIPTEGDTDADAVTHEVKPDSKPAAKPTPKAPSPPAPGSIEAQLLEAAGGDRNRINTVLKNIFPDTGYTELNDAERKILLETLQKNKGGKK